ncbi:hypothetical protein NFI96_009309 [Prochilodus magdalenae]|nr:hypothetical protein NFI96_009309 [Prochilodus magdalenae]
MNPRREQWIKWQGESGLLKMFDIPVGARHIVIEENEASPHIIATTTDLQRAVVSSMSHPGCTTQDYMHTDRYHDCP